MFKKWRKNREMLRRIYMLFHHSGTQSSHEGLWRYLLVDGSPVGSWKNAVKNLWRGSGAHMDAPKTYMDREPKY
jgi:hypothetical protein